MIRNPYLWFSIGLNICLYLVYAWIDSATTGTWSWFQLGGDSPEYLCYGESILSGHFICKGTLFNRMPGYPAFYAAFRFFLNPAYAMTALVWLQVVGSGIAMFMLASIATDILKIRIRPGLMILFFSSLWVYKSYDGILLTESLAYTSLVSGLYFALKPGFRWRNLLISGILFTICVFLRPYAILLVCCVCLFLFWEGIRNRQALARIVGGVMVFLIPFIVLESAWVIRNFRAAGRLVAFQESNRYPGLNSTEEAAASAYNKLWDWIRCVGEDGVFWNPGSLGSWMYGSSFSPDTFYYAPHMLTRSCGINEIERMRTLYKIQDDSPDPEIRESARTELVALADKMMEAYKNEKPFQFYMGAPSRIVYRSFVHSGPIVPVPPYPEIMHHPFQLAVKMYAIITYWLILICGILAMIFYARRSSVILLCAVMVLSLVVFLGVYLRYTEFRLYNMMFPLMALLTVYLADRWLMRLMPKSQWPKWNRLIAAGRIRTTH